MAKFMINNRTDVWKTDVNLLSLTTQHTALFENNCEAKWSRRPISIENGKTNVTNRRNRVGLPVQFFWEFNLNHDIQLALAVIKFEDCIQSLFPTLEDNRTALPILSIHYMQHMRERSFARKKVHKFSHPWLRWLFSQACVRVIKPRTSLNYIYTVYINLSVFGQDSIYIERILFLISQRIHPH